MSMRPPGRAAAGLAALALLAILAGCGASGHVVSVPPAPSAGVPVPDGVADPAVIPSSTGSPAPACNPRQSLRPQGPLPAPGAMPTGSSMAEIVHNGVLKVGVDQNSFLFGFRKASTGEIVGFDIDIAKEVARALFGDPDKVQLVSITSAQRIKYLQDKTVDIVSDSMTITCDRLQSVDFSTDYFDAGQKILVPTSSAIKSKDDLGGKKVCAAAGTTSIATIATLPVHAVPVSVNDWTDCLVMLQQGQIDAISTDDNILLGLQRQDPNTTIVGDRFTDEPHGLAISQQRPDFVRFVNAVLERMRADGTWARIYTAWLGGTAPAPPAAQYKD